MAFTGAGNTLAVVRQASPLITALMLSGVAGSAICADLGSRRIREEIDAMEVMGLSVMERLVVPRMFAIVAVAVLLNGVVMFFTILTTLSISVVVQDLPPGSLPGLGHHARADLRPVAVPGKGRDLRGDLRDRRVLQGARRQPRPDRRR
nr:ABC transporter permease [Nocardioides convexus]